MDPTANQIATLVVGIGLLAILALIRVFGKAAAETAQAEAESENEATQAEDWNK